VPRIVAHVRSGEFPLNFERRWRRPIARYVFSRVDCFIFLSNDLARQVEAHIPESRRAVVPNCIDEAVRCTTEEVATKLESRRRRARFRVLYLANMMPTKGYWDVAEAVRQVVSKGPAPPVEVDFAGAWPSQRDRETFESFLREHGLAGAARLHASVTDRDEVKRLLLGADALVLPTYYPEAQPRSIIEAMNAATPIIACPEASIPEYVHDGINGYLVEPRSPGQIASAIERLLDPATWQARAEASRRIYLETFEPARIQRALLAAVLGRPAPETDPPPPQPDLLAPR
jgi:glycosyltransferase involved in cell wall biosynthesis